jgi:hypothetical protein
MATSPTLPLDVAGSNELVDSIQIESPDYTEYELLSTGVYASVTRTVKAERRVDKNGNPFVMARLEFDQLINTDAENPQTFYFRKPLVRYIFSFTRSRKGHQGETSDISSYLKAAGIELGGDVNVETLKNALGESGNYPVRVKIDWTNRTPKVGEDFLPEVAYTSDFRRGENGAAGLVPTITAEDLAGMSEKAQTRLAPAMVGGRIQAKHRVGGFYRA